MEIKFDGNFNKSFSKIGEAEKKAVMESVYELKDYISSRIANLDIDDKIYGKSIRQHNIGYKVINDTLVIMNFRKRLSNMSLLSITQFKPMDRDNDYSDDGGLDPDGNPTWDNQQDQDQEQAKKPKHNILTLINISDFTSGIKELAKKMSKRVKEIEELESSGEISSKMSEAFIEQIYEDKNPVSYKNENGYNISLDFNKGQDAD